MLPYIHIILPFYGVFVVLGITVSFILYMKRSCILSLGMYKNIQIAAAASIGMLAGSRILFVLTMIPIVMKDFSLEQLFGIILGGGFVFYGGLLGAVSGLYLYGRIRKLNVDDLFQIVVPCFPLFHAFGRIGCFMSGCCYGIPCSFGFAMAADPDVIRFPVQLVESLFCFIIFIILLTVEKHFPKVRLIKVYLASYAAVRFGLEFLRGDSVRGIFLCFSTSQWISLGVLSFLAMEVAADNKRKR